MADNGGETPLMSVIAAGTIVGEGMQMREVRDDNMKYRYYRRLQIVELLLEHKANINAKTLDGETAMCRAIRAGHETVVIVS